MTLEELGRRAVACRHWHWLPGMLVDGIRIDGTCHLVGGLGKPWRQEDFREVICDKCVPDLSDPATLGCLLALVREAWANDTMHARPEGDRWRVWSEEPGAFVFGTEAEALVAALEAAP